MGNVGSRPDDAAAAYLTDQTRFSISGLTITNTHGRNPIHISPNAFPTTRYTARRGAGDDTPLDYVQDPESFPGSPPSFLLRFSNEEELIFNFTCTIRQQPMSPSSSTGDSIIAINPTQGLDTQVTGLTYIFASNAREIEKLATREFHADPNLHRNPNVELVGHYGTDGTPSVQFQWSWKWRPPKQAEDRGGGWRNTCSFVEYNQRAHRLDTLASFSFWVQNNPFYLNSPQSRSPRLEMLSPPRLRVPSTQSVESRMSAISDSDGGEYKDLREPSSPYIESIPEYGLGLVPSMTNGPLPPKVDVNCVGRPGEDMTSADDGPVFRATMRALENKTGTMKSRMKRVLKAAEAVEEAQSSCNSAVTAFMDALREASNSNANAVRPALEHYFDSIAKEILHYEKQNNVNLKQLIIDPISKLYSVDIKQADYKRRDFEEESKDYYAYVGKYLGQRSASLKEKKQVESDAKYQSKRRTFELKRFDYSSFMHDLNGGRKEQEVLSQLTKYAEAQARGYLTTSKKVEEMMPQLEALCLEVDKVDKEFQLQRTERETKRRALETSSKTTASEADVVPPLPVSNGTRPSELDPHRSGSIMSSRNSMMSTSPAAGNGFPPGGPMNTITSPTSGATPALPTRDSSNKFKGIRDLEDKEFTSSGTGQIRKEGLLWSLSRPGSHVDPIMNKAAWHKFWIVLDGGRLSEYANWKDRLDLHMEPIDLRVASVREARNAERRFCFEVITPQFTRVYQAPSEEDMKSWIGSINNALQSAFESRPSTAVSEPISHPGSTRNNIAAVLTGKSHSTSGHRSSAHITGYVQHSNSSKTAVSRHATVGDKPNYLRSNSDEHNPSALLVQIREADAGNKFCADCNSESKVDWVSINLGIVLCIECSGIHRSLGTHITKVRSLTLDTSAFTPDIIDLLLLIGNRVSNMIWEAKLDRFLKPSPHSTREQRLHFITAKYSDRTYVKPLGLSTLSHFGTPDEALLASIKKSEIQNVLYSLALRANPNATDRMRATPAIYLALAAADPAAPGMSTMTSAMPSSSSGFSHSRGTSTVTMKDYGPGIPLSPRPITPVTTPSSTSSNSPHQPLGRKPFAIAELLFQNGADIPTQAAPIPLSHAAKQYLEFKIDQRTGRHLGLGVKDSAGDTISALPSINQGGSGSSPRGGGGSDKEGRDSIIGGHSHRESGNGREWKGEGLVKRLSSGSYGKR